MPFELQQNSDWHNWKSDYNHLQFAPFTFADDDALGTFIELGIHNNFMHDAAGLAFNDDEIVTLHSPQSTLFYKIHGLVQNWLTRFQSFQVFDPRRPVAMASVFGASTVFNPIKPTVSQASGATIPAVDPVEIASLRSRLERVESRVFPMRFVETAEAPAHDGGDMGKSQAA